MYYHEQQNQAQQAAYERAIGAQASNSQCIGMLDQDGRLESFGGPAMQPRNQINQLGLMDGLNGITDRLDRLHQELDILEDRLSPLTGGPVPTACGNQTQQPEPAAIEEIARIIMRLNSAVSTVESIANRVRI